MGIMRDITPVKRAERSLRESEERYRTLFEVGADAVLIVGEDTTQIIDANESAIDLYGYTRDEFRSLKAADLSAEPTEKADSPGSFAGETVAGPTEKTRIPVRHQRKKDGTVFDVEITASHFRLGQRSLIINSIRDITEKRRLQEAMAQTAKLESLGVLAGGIAHDFNNLLMGVFGNIEMANAGLPAGHNPSKPCRVRDS